MSKAVKLWSLRFFLSIFDVLRSLMMNDTDPRRVTRTTNGKDYNDTDPRNVIWATKLDYTRTTSDRWI